VALKALDAEENNWLRKLETAAAGQFRCMMPNCGRVIKNYGGKFNEWYVSKFKTMRGSRI
jgi:hypothetical protein